jgi:hypothetical protein
VVSVVRGLVWLFAFAMGVVGCGDLPDSQLVIERRILAARPWVVDALEPTAPGARDRAEALPLETLQIDPLWVGPNGVIPSDDVDAVWIACELTLGAPPFTCLSQRFGDLTLDDLPACVVDDPDAPPSSPRQVPSPCLLERTGAPSLTVPLSTGILAGADLELTVVTGDPDGTSTDACADALLAGEWDPPSDCIYGVQVVPVGPKPTLLAAAQAAGLVPDDVALPPADDPDTHPRITSFRVTVLDGDGDAVGEAREVARGEIVDVPRGTTLRIDTTSPQDDLQTFSVIVNDGASAEDREESYIGQWFRTWGSQLATASLSPESYNEWTLDPDGDDPELPEDGLAHLYYVVRDARHGVAWWWFSARVVP